MLKFFRKMLSRPHVPANKLDGSYTPIKLWSTETIGYEEGYYKCQYEQLDAQIQYYADIKTMGYEEAMTLMKKRSKAVERKYFGPKYIKA